MGLIDFVLLYNVASGELLRKAFIERKCAVISPSDRIDCGYEGITVERCVHRKCCWDETAGTGVPWCYQSLIAMSSSEPASLMPLEQTCSGDPIKRQDCGWNRITENQCAELGCCFDDRVKGVPWCFYQMQQSSKDRNFKFVLRSENKFCTKPPTVNKEGYTYTCTDGFRHNSVCTISCSNGISGLGKQYPVNCEGGEWHGPDVPTCDAVWRIPSKSEQNELRFVDRLRLQKMIYHKYVTAGKCHAPDSPENGSRSCAKVNSVMPNSGIGYQYVCTFTCNEGYQISGITQRSCPSNFGNNPTWTGTTPECIPFAGSSVVSSRTVPNGCLGMRENKDIINMDCNPDEIYGNMICKLSCPTEYRLVGGPRFVTCPYDKRIELPPRAVCVQGYCDKLTAPKHGEVSCNEKELNGSQCEFSCNVGYRLIGPSIITCDNVSWSNQPPICVNEKLHSMGDCGTARYSVTRLLNGEKATEGQFQIAITYQGEFRCSGVIIDEEWALTAAHCVQGLTRFFRAYTQVRNVQSLTQSKEIQIDHIHRHESWNRKSQFDIALIKFKSAVSSELSVCMPPADSNLPLGEEVRAYGYGYTSPDADSQFASSLLMGKIQYVPPNDCGFIKRRFHYENLFCGRGDSDTCDGDSGGPVLHKQDGRYVLVGIVSSGQCGSPNPGLYVRVSKFVQWIQNYIYEQSSNSV